MEMNELVKAVQEWSINKELHQADPAKQFLKVAEEFGEIGAAMARGQRDELQDAIGDTTVTLIILAQQHDMEYADCLETAYNVIAKRKGKMVDGVFVKSEDLKE